MGCETVSLADIAVLIPGFSFKSKEFGSGFARAIKIGNISRGINSCDLPIVDTSKYAVGKLGKYQCVRGDYLVAMTGNTIGKIGRMLTGTAYANQRVLKVSGTDKVEPGFLWAALCTTGFHSHVLSHVDSHSAQPNISAKSIGEFKIELPDLATQKRISSVFMSIEEKIEVNNRLNGYLLELAMARFESALRGGSKTVRFSDIVALEDSKRVPLNSRDREARKGPYPYYGATSVMDYVDDYLFDGIRVLLGEDGTVIDSGGRPILQYVWGKYWVNNHAHILASSGEYSLEAIYVALRRTAINHIVTGAVQMKISQRNLKSLELEMPNLKNLDYLQDLFAAYRSNQDESAKLAFLRDALLPKLMSGEIDVSKVDLTQLNSHLA